LDVRGRADRKGCGGERDGWRWCHAGARDEEGRARGRPPEAGDDELGGLVGEVSGGGSRGTI
jgi:hypothetical protein